MGFADHVDGIDPWPDHRALRGKSLHAQRAQVGDVVGDRSHIGGEADRARRRDKKVAPRGVEASDEIAMPRPAAVGRRQARATDVLSGNEGLLGPPSAGQPDATVHHRVHQTRQDPILALAEDTGGSQDDDLEILGRP